MTTEAEIVVFHIEGGVELRRKFLDQQSVVLAAVGDVAGTAFFLLDGSVEEFFIFNFLLEVGNYSAILPSHRLIVTSDAEGEGIGF